MQTDPTIDPAANPANQPIDDPEQQPRRASGLPPDMDPLAPMPSPDTFHDIVVSTVTPVQAPEYAARD